MIGDGSDAPERFSSVKAILDGESRRIWNDTIEQQRVRNLLRDVLKAISVIPRDDKGNGLDLAICLALKAVADTDDE